MADRPILFSAPMVRALLAGTKTQTRRVVKDTGLYAIEAAIHGQETAARELLALATRCPYGQSGDRLWVREAWAPYMGKYGRPTYRADPEWQGVPAPRPDGRWLPSIHMPRAASRITLEVTSVRVERLQDISEADAIAEGVADEGTVTFRVDGSEVRGAVAEYATLWEQINGPGSWDANPWVWVVEFKRLEVSHG